MNTNNNTNNSKQIVENYQRGDGKVFTHVYNDEKKLHCLNGPAIQTDCSKEYYENGMRHRQNGPAVLITKDNYIRAEWWQNGVLHRENNKPAIIDSDGSMEFWINGEKQINFTNI